MVSAILLLASTITLVASKTSSASLPFLGSFLTPSSLCSASSFILAYAAAITNPNIIKPIKNPILKRTTLVPSIFNSRCCSVYKDSNFNESFMCIISF
ncbi:hypothetical protein V6Z12_A01G040000 [Gossypium hirsutum]